MRGIFIFQLEFEISASFRNKLFFFDGGTVSTPVTHQTISFCDINFLALTVKSI